MGSWKSVHPRQLRKIVFGLTESSIQKVIEEHEKRGWKMSGEIKKHGYGLGCLMIWSSESQLKEG